jgi:integrase
MRGELGGRDRGLRERFGGAGNLTPRLVYSTVRQRLNSLRHCLQDAVQRGVLAAMPEPWPIPPRGSHGHVARATYLLKPELEVAKAREQHKHFLPAETSKCGVPIGDPTPGAATLGEYLDLHLKHSMRRARPATHAMHTEHARNLKRFFSANRPIAAFRGPAGYRLLVEYVEREGPEDGGRGVKFTSVKKRLNTLRVVFREAIQRGDLDVMPPFPELPCDSEPRERYLTVNEYRQIRAVIAQPWDLATAIGVSTGQHTSDIMSMSYAMVDLGAGPGAGPGPGPAFWLRRNTKNKKKTAWLPMPDDLREVLTSAYARNPPENPNVVIVSGNAHQFRKHLRRACRKLGIPVASPIDLRRTCATWWVERGGPKDALRRWLGHSVNSAIVERHYSQVTPDMVDGGVQALNRAARDPGSGVTPQWFGPRLLPPAAPDAGRPVL